MSNRAYLIASQNSTPAGTRSDGNTNYATTEVIADGGSYQLPIFWFSLFSQSNLCIHQFDDFRASTLICDRATAWNNLRERRASVLAAFPGCDAHWDVWQQLTEGSTGSHFKLDATEIWDLDPDSYERDFPAAVRWFSSGAAEDFAALLSLGALNYDSATRQLTVGTSAVIGEHLYGYRMNASPPPGPPPLPPPIPPPLPPPSKNPWWKLFL